MNFSLTRFWDKVDRSRGPEACWLWTASLSRGGYGQFSLGGTTVRSHRLAWELLVGPIPAGLTLDHVRERCHNRHCVNPAHLEPVTLSENVRRAKAAVSHCPAGHAYAGSNLYVPARGGRQCRTCVRDRAREYQRQRRKEAAA